MISCSGCFMNEKSMALPNAPVIREPEITWIKESEKAQVSLQKSTDRYKEFLAIEKYWKLSHNHNHLRITRVIKSLSLLRSDDEANRFKHWVTAELDDHIDKISEKTKQFWRLA